MNNPETTIDEDRKCDWCHGAGKVPQFDAGPVDCPVCKGTGHKGALPEVWRRNPDYDRGYLAGMKDARRLFIDCRHDEKSGRKFLAFIDQVLEKVANR